MRGRPKGHLPSFRWAVPAPSAAPFKNAHRDAAPQHLPAHETSKGAKRGSTPSGRRAPTWNLLGAFVNFKYPNEIGPGVYDIHSPRVPDVDERVSLLRKAAGRLKG
ncbi:MAG TPA: hypothetical protein PLN52_21260 [Opitutaceae bacterium]|nr:hypothetical protein [Opitutaceae bacterium]